MPVEGAVAGAPAPWPLLFGTGAAAFCGELPVVVPPVVVTPLVVVLPVVVLVEAGVVLFFFDELFEELGFWVW